MSTSNYSPHEEKLALDRTQAELRDRIQLIESRIAIKELVLQEHDLLQKEQALERQLQERGVHYPLKASEATSSTTTLLSSEMKIKFLKEYLASQCPDQGSIRVAVLRSSPCQYSFPLWAEGSEVKAGEWSIEEESYILSELENGHRLEYTAEDCGREPTELEERAQLWIRHLPKESEFTDLKLALFFDLLLEQVQQLRRS